MSTEQAPHFVYDDVTNLGHREALQYLEQAIRSNPLAVLGAITFASLDNTYTLDTEAERPAYNLLREILEKRIDRNLEFDDDTEAALSADDTHRALIEACQNSKLRPVMKNGHMRGSVPNLEADEKRRAVSLSRFRLFTQRTIDFQSTLN